MAVFGMGRSKRTVGLDIGSGYIKLVVMEHGKGRPRIVRAAATPLVADAIVEGDVMDPTLVASTIRSLFETAGVKDRKVVTAVGGRDVIIKRIQMDRMKESDARDVIRWEAEQHVPFDMESVELDFQILDPKAEGLQMTVLLVAAKRELVENKVALLLDAGLEPDIIDVDAFALHNAFELNYPEAMSGVVGFVNIGHETTNVNLLEDGVPVLNRDRCIGCGLCVSTCPTESLTLVRKPEPEQSKIPMDMKEASIRLGRERRKLRPVNLVQMQLRSKLDRLLASR